MADIQNLLKQLLTAVYGKDVRQTIHDSIKQCYADTSKGVTPVITTTSVDGGTEVTIKVGANTTKFVVEDGTATDEQVSAWLDAHPDVTTSIEDGSVTEEKLSEDLKNKFTQLSSDIEEINESIESLTLADGEGY